MVFWTFFEPWALLFWAFIGDYDLVFWGLLRQILVGLGLVGSVFWVWFGLVGFEVFGAGQVSLVWNVSLGSRPEIL